MAQARFEELHEELLRAGVAPRNARRAVVEIESHFQQLLDEESARGSSADAGIEANRRMGTNQELVRQYAARPELRAWSHRWPSVWFTIVPLLIFFAVGFGTLLCIGSIGDHLEPYLRRITITPRLNTKIELAASVALLWCLPLCVSAAFTLLARRRYLHVRWAIISVTLISILASLSNVTVTVIGGSDYWGEVGAGIGFSPHSLPGQSMHAALLIALSMMALRWLRAPRERDLN